MRMNVCGGCALAVCISARNPGFSGITHMLAAVYAPLLLAFARTPWSRPLRVLPMVALWCA